MLFNYILAVNYLQGSCAKANVLGVIIYMSIIIIRVLKFSTSTYTNEIRDKTMEKLIWKTGNQGLCLQDDLVYNWKIVRWLCNRQPQDPGFEILSIGGNQEDSPHKEGLLGSWELIQINVFIVWSQLLHIAEYVIS